jgi:hypothetical protein
MDDEFTPRERGLLIGHAWAQEAASWEAAKQVADAEQVPDDVREVMLGHGGMRERLEASIDPNAEAAFWGGFVHGVRAFVKEELNHAAAKLN